MRGSHGAPQPPTHPRPWIRGSGGRRAGGKRGHAGCGAAQERSWGGRIKVAGERIRGHGGGGGHSGEHAGLQPRAGSKLGRAGSRDGSGARGAPGRALPAGRRTPGFHLKARSAQPSRSCRRPPPPRGPRSPPRRHAELLASLPSPFF